MNHASQERDLRRSVIKNKSPLTFHTSTAWLINTCRHCRASPQLCWHILISSDYGGFLSLCSKCTFPTYRTASSHLPMRCPWSTSCNALWQRCTPWTHRLPTSMPSFTFDSWPSTSETPWPWRKRLVFECAIEEESLKVLMNSHIYRCGKKVYCYLKKRFILILMQCLSS